MTRVLHLVPERTDFQTSRSVASLAGLAGVTLATQVVSQMPRAVGNLRRGVPFRPDVIHAWGMRALAAAVLGGGAPVVFSPLSFPTPRVIGWLRAAMAYRDVHVVCPTATQRRACVERGLPLERCHLVRPGVDFSCVRRRRDPELRRSLGFSDDDHVVLAAGESTRAAAHGDAVWTIAIAHYLDPRFKLLLWGRGEGAPTALARARKLAGEAAVAAAEPALGRVEFDALLPAADAVLVTARGPVATLPIATCMAAGLPIVSTVTYTVAELLEDRHTALMVPRPEPRLIARKLLDLKEDTATQWSIADMARTEAYEYFSLTRFREQFHAAYSQIAAGAKVDIPKPNPGAGRRFHGRG
jgi:glycosyltransferase involved in cell wall biosynthesis